MSRTRTPWLLGIAVAAACVGACVAPVSPPDPGPAPEAEAWEPPAAPAEDLKALADGNNAFALDLYKKLAETETGNIVVSPYSIRTALGMTYAGARGETAAEMRKVLHLTLPDDRLHAAFGATAHQLQGGKDRPFQLNVANALWGQSGYGFRPEFLTLTRKNYGGGLRELDFVGDAEGSRQTINRWVEVKTHDKIKELLKPDDLGPKTRLVLTNAIYFKASWATPFFQGGTKDALFEVAPGEKITVPMMQTQGHFRYLVADNGEWLELPYVGGRVSMVLLLPQRGQLSAVEKRLTPAAIRETVEKLAMHSGEVSLPKFQVRTAVGLNEVLIRMGMPLAFSDADFSGMTGSRELHIARVVHQAYLNVNELGSEAAAATAVVMACSDPPPFSFTADRPFLFFLRDNQMGSILFSGRLVQPSK